MFSTPKLGESLFPIGSPPDAGHDNLQINGSSKDSSKRRRLHGETSDPTEPLSKSGQGTNPFKDINMVGGDGKALAIRVGVLADYPEYSVFAKRRGGTIFSKGSIMFYMATEERKESLGGKKQLAYVDIKFSNEYPATEEEIKKRLVSELSETTWLLLGSRATTNETIGHIPKKTKKVVNKEACQPRPTQPALHTSTRRSHSHTILIDEDEHMDDDEMRFSKSHHAAVESFKESIDKIEEPFKKRIDELEKRLKALQLSKQRDQLYILDLKTITKADSKSIQSLREQVNSLVKKQEDNSLTARLSVATTLNAANSNKLSEQEFNTLEMKYAETKVQLETLQKSQETLHELNAKNTAQPIDFTNLKEFSGENAGFLEGPLGDLRMLDGLACKDYVLLRENRKFHFEGASSDEVVASDGTKRIRREVVAQTDAYKSKYIIVERGEVVHEGDKEYTVFDVARCFYLRF